MLKKYKNLIIVMGLLILSSYTLCSAIARPLWFDEALTVINFVMCPYLEIYTNYAIPNNHIGFNLLLSIWLDSAGTLFDVSEIQFRLFPFLTSLIIIAFMFHFWRKRVGTYITVLTITAFATSIPFIIYGTALRGYILSLLFILFGLESILRWDTSHKKKYLFYYFISALIAISIIPSNLIAFMTLSILPIKYNFYKKSSKPNISILFLFIKKRILFITLPFIGFFIFYAPIFKALYSALKHNNGWLHPLAACIHLYSGFLLPLLPIIILAIFGIIVSIKQIKRNLLQRISLNERPRPKGRSIKPTCGNKYRENIFSSILIIIIFSLPALITLSRTPAPFPRVFFQMWPIWLYLIAKMILPLFALIRKKSQIYFNITFFISLTVILAWGIIQHNYSAKLSKWLTPQHSQDDFFQPYYMTNFTPLNILNRLLDLSQGKDKMVFLSQNADFPSIMFYGKLKGIPYDFWLYDSPEQSNVTIKSHRKNFYILANNEYDLKLIIKRFKFINIKPLYTKGYQKIYSAEIE